MGTPPWSALTHHSTVISSPGAYVEVPLGDVEAVRAGSADVRVVLIPVGPRRRGRVRRRGHVRRRGLLGLVLPLSFRALLTAVVLLAHFSGARLDALDLSFDLLAVVVVPFVVVS